MKKLGFVIPWYSENITGGAETELKGIVEHLAEKGTQLEVLTTCVEKFNSDWSKNYWQEGVEIINKINVRRFKVTGRNAKIFDEINSKLMANQTVSTDEQKKFMKNFVNSPDLYKYIKTHQNEYSLFVYIPYMFSINYYGMLECPEKSVLIPCFHEESYIHLDIYKNVIEKIAGLIYLSNPEKKLANKIFDLSNVKQAVLGAGVDTDFEYSSETFRNKYHLYEPFILYAGRKDVGKNIYLLIQYFEQYLKMHQGSKLKLVLMGGGKVVIPGRLKDKIIDLGYVDLQDKHDGCAAASVLCQPSVHESFSIVIMESWLGERPVLVHENCEVTKNFCKETNAGLWFGNYYEFEAELDFILNNENISSQMGKNGRKYVVQNFSWDVISQKYMTFFNDLINIGENKHGTKANF